METALKLVDNDDMAQDPYEIRDRTTRLESKYEFIEKSVIDHLDRWDKQWTVIDDIRQRLIVLETIQTNVQKNEDRIKALENAFSLTKLEISNMNTERVTWGGVIRWIIAIVGVGATITTLLLKFSK